jgi:hypothetical protein
LPFSSSDLCSTSTSEPAGQARVPQPSHDDVDEVIDDDIDEKDAAEEGTFVPGSGSAL